MKLLTKEVEYNKTIRLAANLTGEYTKPVTFHCFWKGPALTQAHLYSIKSCYYFNVYKRNHKIILWLEDNSPNKYNKEIKKYAEIKHFSLKNEVGEVKDIFFGNYNPDPRPGFYSDYVRYILLYKYGGCWFDLDCFFLRNFDPLFHNYGDGVCVYQWEKKSWPNGAIYISLEPKSDKMKKNIEFIIKHNKGWGFQQARLKYDLDLDLLVLPCSWFDGGWIENPYNVRYGDILKSTPNKYDFDTFFKGAFSYHWHLTRRSTPWHSIASQLIKLIDLELGQISHFSYSLYLLSLSIYSKTIQAPEKAVMDFLASSLNHRVRDAFARTFLHIM